MGAADCREEIQVSGVYCISILDIVGEFFFSFHLGRQQDDKLGQDRWEWRLIIGFEEYTCPAMPYMLGRSLSDYVYSLAEEMRRKGASERGYRSHGV